MITPVTNRPTVDAMTSSASATRLRRRVAALVAAMAAGVMLPGPAVAATPQHVDARANACTFAAYPPNREGSTLRAWGEKWGCEPSTYWTITLQRHRGATWWQNEGVNHHTGDNWVSVAAGCVSGTWTYRTILESNRGHKTVSANRTITC